MTTKTVGGSTTPQKVGDIWSFLHFFRTVYAEFTQFYKGLLEAPLLLLYTRSMIILGS